MTWTLAWAAAGTSGTVVLPVSGWGLKFSKQKDNLNLNLEVKGNEYVPLVIFILELPRLRIDRLYESCSTSMM